jgi:hypothetical protein
MKPRLEAEVKSLCRTLGLILVLFSPIGALAWWRVNQQPLEVLAQVERRRGILDSATIASAMYHASHARAALATRWHPTGFATLAVLGAIAGLTLIYFSRTRRAGTPFDHD